MSNKRGPSASPGYEEAPSSSSKRPRSSPSAGPGPSRPTVSLHQWLHPELPAPTFTHSPPLHASSSTFLSFTYTFEAPSHVTSVGSLEKEIRRIVRELDVVKEVGELVMKADEGAFADGEGRAPGRGKFSGRERAREPDHRMWACRTLALREGKNGTGGEGDYQLLEVQNDDGEKFGGQTIMRVLQDENAVDVLTICCRWYGGEMIGPIRFQHITTTALTSLRSTIKLNALRDIRTTLEVLDEDIAALRASLPSSGTADPMASIVEKGKYDDVLDEAKLQRLVVARERTKAALEKKLANGGGQSASGS
ncbi:hypothetical protein IAU60_002165 [Kwoniella sp. DSM 27419]